MTKRSFKPFFVAPTGLAKDHLISEWASRASEPGHEMFCRCADFVRQYNPKSKTDATLWFDQNIRPARQEFISSAKSRGRSIKEVHDSEAQSPQSTLSADELEEEVPGEAYWIAIPPVKVSRSVPSEKLVERYENGSKGKARERPKIHSAQVNSTGPSVYSVATVVPPTPERAGNVSPVPAGPSRVPENEESCRKREAVDDGSSSSLETSGRHLKRPRRGSTSRLVPGTSSFSNLNSLERPNKFGSKNHILQPDIVVDDNGPPPSQLHHDNVFFNTTGLSSPQSISSHRWLSQLAPRIQHTFNETEVFVDAVRGVYEAAARSHGDPMLPFSVESMSGFWNLYHFLLGVASKYGVFHVGVSERWAKFKENTFPDVFGSILARNRSQNTSQHSNPFKSYVLQQIEPSGAAISSIKGWRSTQIDVDTPQSKDLIDLALRPKKQLWSDNEVTLALINYWDSLSKNGGRSKHYHDGSDLTECASFPSPHSCPFIIDIFNLTSLGASSNLGQLRREFLPRASWGLEHSTSPCSIAPVGVGSVDIHHLGAPKVWYTFHPEFRYKLSEMARQFTLDKQTISDKTGCPQSFSRSRMLFYPEFLRNKDIPYFTIVQRAGDIVAFPGLAPHQEICLDVNYTEAVFFRAADHVDHSDPSPMGEGNGVNIDTYAGYRSLFP